eukprot:m.114333 g.114333  ORF g.114333 m.114333 type:complete len:96 (-) comp21510_c0_seq2:22-309(-)
MPLGMSWGKYLGTVAVTLSSMLAGASVVHAVFQPDLTIPDTPIPRPSGEVRTTQRGPGARVLGLKVDVVGRDVYLCLPISHACVRVCAVCPVLCG